MYGHGLESKLVKCREGSRLTMAGTDKQHERIPTRNSKTVLYGGP